MSYPELEKMQAVSGESQKIGRFLEWLQSEREPRIELAVWHGGKFGDELRPSNLKIEPLLAEYFNIDLVIVEYERRVMLDSIREGGRE